MKMVRWIFAIVLFAAASTLAGAQQITRVAVINRTTIYMAFFRDSKAVRDLEDKRSKILADIAKMDLEIKNLKQQKTDADSAGDSEKSQSLDAQIKQKTQNEQDYYRTKYAEYNDQKSKLADTSVFTKELQKQIETVAESNGYTIVLDVTQDSGIVWYSPSVDITQMVIDSLQQSSSAGN
jgi:outer membrane protein